MSELAYLRSTFAQDAELCDRVLAAARQNRTQLQLFVDMARHLSSSSGSSAHPAVTNGTSTSTDPSSSNKKRKLDETTSSAAPAPAVAAAAAAASVSGPILLHIPDISFTIPVRKKLSLSVHGAGLRITGKDGTSAPLYSIPWTSIARAFCLPIPDRAVRAHNFVLITKGLGEEQFVFALGETGCAGLVECEEVREGDTWVSLLGRLVNAHLMACGRGMVQLPSDEEFRAEAVQNAWGQKGWGVKAHLGNKDGYLFFLASGIVFGFRKPIWYFPFAVIQSISYTSVLQRTFNLVITVSPSSDAEFPGATIPTSSTDQPREEEFAMLDQADFAGIDAYVKKHGLNDASMAVERMAKRVGVNDPKRRKGEDGEQVAGLGNGVDGDEEETELAKAERELQDAEDEEEEDYDPGSEGGSEGEGSDSEGEEDGGGEAEGGGDEL